VHLPTKIIYHCQTINYEPEIFIVSLPEADPVEGAEKWNLAEVVLGQMLLIFFLCNLQGSLTEREGSVKLTSYVLTSLDQLLFTLKIF
jgi:hypothetical protein